LKAALYTLAAVIVVSAAAHAWTNRHSYGSTQTGDGIRLLARTDRFTGHSEELWVGLGWRPAETPWASIKVEMSRSETPASLAEALSKRP
jgi:hypothetical protein